jgi:hypothetical protein
MVKAKEEKAKEEANWEVKVFLTLGGAVIFGPFKKSAAQNQAKFIIANGCDKDDTYYPASAIAKVKVYQVAPIGA